MNSIYKHASNRATLARHRRSGEEVPKCAAYFNYGDDCDIPQSHICGPSEMTLAFQKMLQKSGNATEGELKWE